MKVWKIILLTFVVAIIGLWIVSGEIQRRQGLLVPSVAKYYRSSNAALAPLNLWVSKNSFAKSGSKSEGQLPDMDTFFPRHSVLQDNWTAIRDEALNLYHTGHATKINKDLFFSNIADQHWKKFYLKWYPTSGAEDGAEGKCLEDARVSCPQTSALLESLPEVHMAMLSILDPGAQIIPHHGVWKNVVRYHLCLSAPKMVSNHNAPALNISESVTPSPTPGSAPGCSIFIDGHIRYTWKDGEDVLFDDTYVHSVQNNTLEPRIILLCDVERKMASSFAQKVNHWFSTTLGPLTTKKNDKVEKASARNTT